MNIPAAPISTPCVKICVVDGESGLCLGCLRTLKEIAAWSGMGTEARAAIMGDLPGRRSKVSPDKLALVR